MKLVNKPANLLVRNPDHPTDRDKYISYNYMFNNFAHTPLFSFNFQSLQKAG